MTFKIFILCVAQSLENLEERFDEALNRAPDKQTGAAASNNRARSTDFLRP